jgi:hypothetical protein
MPTSRRRRGTNAGAGGIERMHDFVSNGSASIPFLRLELTLFLWHTIRTHMQGTQRAHILIPADLLREIDAIVGPRGRSAFLLETAREEVRRRKLLSFLESDDPAWQEREHPELERGSAAWVRTLRSQSESRAAGPGAVKPRKSRQSRVRASSSRSASQTSSRTSSRKPR